MVQKPYALVVPKYHQYARLHAAQNGHHFPEPDVLNEGFDSFGRKIWYLMQERYPETAENFDYIPATVRPAADSTQKVKIGRLSGGEEPVEKRTFGTVADKRVFVVHPWYIRPAAEHAMIGNHVIDALYRAEAAGVFFFEPFNPYISYDALHDRENHGADVALGGYKGRASDMEFSYITFVPHSKQVDGFGNIRRLKSLPLIGVFSEYIRGRYNTDSWVISGTDEGSSKVAGKYAHELGRPKVDTRKKKRDMDDVDAVCIEGDVSGMDVCFIDDMIRTGGTLISAAREARSKGAMEIYVCAPHLSLDYNVKEGKPTKELLLGYGIHVIGSDSIPQHFSPEEREFFDVMSLVPISADYIVTRSESRSTSRLFSTADATMFDMLGR